MKLNFSSLKDPKCIILCFDKPFLRRWVQWITNGFNVDGDMLPENDTETEKWAKGEADVLLPHVVGFLPNNQHVDIFLLMTGCFCPKHSLCLSV